jgi:hypothetical protein
VVIRPHVGGTYSNSGSLNRLFWYPEWGTGGYYTPTFWIDGTDSLSYAWTITTWWNQLKSRIASRLSVPSPVEMSLEMTYGAKADTGTAQVQVIAKDPISYSGLRVVMAVIENDLFAFDQPRNQVVRSWEPNWGGISFTISEGDTFTYSEEFVIKTAWVDENCRFVAFVQDDATYDVLQSVQSPIIVPTPVAVTGLTASLADDDIRLDWTAVTEDTHGGPLTVDHYNVYRNTLGFFEPGSDPFTTTADIFYVDDSGVVGDTGTHYFYWVTAQAGYKESAESNGAAEFDKYLITGK